MSAWPIIVLASTRLLTTAAAMAAVAVTAAAVVCAARDTVLAMGGSKPPAEVFRLFRGRDPSTEAILRHAGFTPATAA
jgi:Zn-dependent oligopeptidase